MQAMDKVKFYISSAYFNKTEVKPISTGLFDWIPEEGKAYYKHEMKDKLKFTKINDFQTLLLLEIDECAEVVLHVEVLCNGNFDPYWEGVFTLFDASVNKDRCTIEVKPSSNGAYVCFEESIKKEQNIFASGTAITVTAIGGTYEELSCLGISNNADCTEYYNLRDNPRTQCLPDPSNWCLKSNTVLVDGFDTLPQCDNTNMFLQQETIWHRETVTVPCVNGVVTAPPFGSGWVLLSSDCSGTNSSTWWRCPASGSSKVFEKRQSKIIEETLSYSIKK